MIALVVTIVVLLILAGVTITVVLGEGGIINTALKAKNETEKAAQNEQDQLNGLNNYIANGGWGSGENKPGGDTPNPPEQQTPTLDDLAGQPADENKNIETEDSNGNKIVIPAGFRVLPHGTQSEEIGEVVYNTDQDHKPCVEDGVVIADSKNNQFVWVPVNNPAEMFEVVNGQNVGILYDFSGTTSTRKTYSTNSFREPDVVTAHDNTAIYYTNAGITGITNATEFKAQLQSEFDSMMRSVKHYKGFYIGRYETGDLSKTQAVVKRNNTDIANQNWYVQYQKSKTVASGSSMIWGCQWDATLRWFQKSNDEEVKKFPTDGTGKGNYGGTNENKPIPTGTNNDYRVNNIYDMEGNVYEWTLESEGGMFRVNRGSYYDNPSNSAFSRHNYHPGDNYSKNRQQTLSLCSTVR
ncbi:MAG: hypothetical protein HFJ28_07350 [Clostridia bacterium]|nr:hypothetical protein [Clostridia bacterium]